MTPAEHEIHTDARARPRARLRARQRRARGPHRLRPRRPRPHPARGPLRRAPAAPPGPRRPRHVHGPAAGTRPSPTATTSTTPTMATATPPTRTTTTSTDGTGRQDFAATARGVSCQPRRWPTTCTAWLSAGCGGSTSATPAGRRAIIELLVSAGHPVSIGDIAERLPERAAQLRLPAPDRPAGRRARPAGRRQRRVHPVRAGRGPHRAPPPPAVHQLRQGHRRHARQPPSSSKSAAAIATLADAEGFQAHSHRLDVLGLCAACR